MVVSFSINQRQLWLLEHNHEKRDDERESSETLTIDLELSHSGKGRRQPTVKQWHNRGEVMAKQWRRILGTQRGKLREI